MIVILYIVGWEVKSIKVVLVFSILLLVPLVLLFSFVKILRNSTGTEQIRQIFFILIVMVLYQIRILILYISFFFSQFNSRLKSSFYKK